METIRRVGLHGTELAKAQCTTRRFKLLNIGAGLELHHLLLAAWLRIEPRERGARERLREHASTLETRYRHSCQQWLARLTRRAAALLKGDAPAADDAAMPFFIGPKQDRWREALASIVALGAGPASKSREAGAAADRLIWTVRVDEHFRIAEIASLEQKAGARGLGKVKPVTLATLIKRKHLPAHDAAVLRAVRAKTSATAHFSTPRWPRRRWCATRTSPGRKSRSVSSKWPRRCRRWR